MVVGLTGGIGSGKTFVAKIFNALGVPVFDADTEAKNLYHKEDVKKQVTILLGKEVYHENKVDPKRVASKVFADSNLLKSLEEILYPRLESEFKLWCKSHDEAPYLLKEAAVMIEKGTYKSLNKIILVQAERELKVKRVMKRNGLSKEQVLLRMESQWTDEKKTPFCDYFISNNEKQSLLKQVYRIHQDLLEVACL